MALRLTVAPLDDNQREPLWVSRSTSEEQRSRIISSALLRIPVAVQLASSSEFGHRRAQAALGVTTSSGTTGALECVRRILVLGLGQRPQELEGEPKLNLCRWPIRHPATRGAAGVKGFHGGADLPRGEIGAQGWDGDRYRSSFWPAARVRTYKGAVLPVVAAHLYFAVALD